MRAAHIEVIARAVIRRDGHLLLVRERTKSWFFLPGGHVDPGERVEAGLVRELAEELGAHATIAGFLGVVEYGYIAAGTAHHELNFVFDVVLDDVAAVSREEHLEFQWLPLAHLADADVRPGSLRNALLTADDDRTPFWCPWND